MSVIWVEIILAPEFYHPKGNTLFELTDFSSDLLQHLALFTCGGHYTHTLRHNFLCSNSPL